MNFATIRPRTIGQKGDPSLIGRKEQILREAQSKIQNPKSKINSLELKANLMVLI